MRGLAYDQALTVGPLVAVADGVRSYTMHGKEHHLRVIQCSDTHQPDGHLELQQEWVCGLTGWEWCHTRASLLMSGGRLSCCFANVAIACNRNVGVGAALQHVK